MLEELFTINIPASSLRKIKRIYAITTYLSVLSFCISVAGLFHYLPVFKAFFNDELGNSRIDKLDMYASLIYTSCFVLMFPLQTFFLFRFVSLFRKVAKGFNPDLFSQALTALSIHVMICVFTYTLNFAAFAFALYLKHL